MGTAIDSSSLPSGISPMRRDRARLFVSSIDPFPRFFLIIVNEYYIKGRYDGQGFFLFFVIFLWFFPRRCDTISCGLAQTAQLRKKKRSVDFSVDNTEMLIYNSKACEMLTED